MSGIHFSPLRARTSSRDRIAWLVCATILVAAFGYYLLPHRVHSLPAAVNAVVTTTPRITILSFDRIVADDRSAHLSRVGLRQRLVALQTAGYSAISLKQLADFYAYRQPLPEKPLFLLFEHGYLDSYRYADPVLHELGWPATMGLQTRRQEERDTGFIYWDRVQRMVDSGMWDFVAQGHNADRAVDQADINSGKYLSSRIQVGADRRVETEEEFAARIDQDLLISRTDIESHVAGYHVIGFNYPFGMAHQSDAENALADLAQERVATMFQLAFVDDNFGVNDATSNPQRLKRRRVNSATSTQDLIASIDANRQPASVAESAGRLNARWITESGGAELTPSGILLQGAPHAQTWLAGSQWDTDWIIEADIADVRGEVWLTGTSNSSRREWRFGGSGDALYLQTLDAGKVVQTLARYVPPENSSEIHHLKFIKRGAGVWVEWDGNAIAERPLYMSVRGTGMLGWRTWSDAGTSGATITAFKIKAQPYVVRELAADASAYEIDELITHASDIAAIALPWVDIDQDGMHKQSPGLDIARILAHRYGWDLLAQVNIDDAPAAAHMADTARRALGSEWQGIYIKLAAPATDTLTVQLAEMQYAMRRADQRFVIAPAVSADAIGTEPSLHTVSR